MFRTDKARELTTKHIYQQIKSMPEIDGNVECFNRSAGGIAVKTLYIIFRTEEGLTDQQFIVVLL